MGDEPRCPGLYQRIYELVRKIPRGKVATYGQVAELVGPPCTARTVGWALASLGRSPQEPPVPWQRVISSRGRVSTGPRQRALLEQEGVAFSSDGEVDLSRYRWTA